jgi:hypothetical protein
VQTGSKNPYVQATEQRLRKAGYNELKIDGRLIKVIDWNRFRERIISEIVILFEGEGEWNSKNVSGSTLGQFEFWDGSKVRIQVKPKESQDPDRNEKFFCAKLQEKGMGLDIVLCSPDRRKLLVEKLAFVEHLGRHGGKTDCRLTGENGQISNHSLKQNNSGYYDSSQKYAKEKQELLFDAIAKRKIRADVASNGVWTLTPGNFLVKATPEEANFALFGLEGEELDCVVRQTFEDKHFVVNGNTLEIWVTDFVDQESDLPDVYHILHNEPSRTSKHLKKGLRLKMCTQKRAFEGKYYLYDQKEEGPSVVKIDTKLCEAAMQHTEHMIAMTIANKYHDGASVLH